MTRAVAGQCSAHTGGVAQAARLRAGPGVRGSERPRGVAPRSGVADGGLPGGDAGQSVDAVPAGAGCRPRQRLGDPRGAVRAVRGGAPGSAEASDPGLRRHGHALARGAGGPVLPRLLRRLLPSAAVRVLRPAPARELPASERHRCGAPRLGDSVVAGPGAARALAEGGDRVPGRQRLLPLADAALVREPRRALHRGDRQEQSASGAGGRVDRPGRAGLRGHGQEAAAVRFGRLRCGHVGQGAPGDRQGRARRTRRQSALRGHEPCRRRTAISTTGCTAHAATWRTG